MQEIGERVIKAETELLGFAVSGHPLDLYSDVRWSSYCPIGDVGNYPTRSVTVAGMIVEDRLHHQIDGRIMKFISVCDYSGMLECELFARAYRTFGAETIRHPVVEVSGRFNLLSQQQPIHPPSRSGEESQDFAVISGAFDVGWLFLRDPRLCALIPVRRMS
jgi:DNA polymerase III alpha subunit